MFSGLNTAGKIPFNYGKATIKLDSVVDIMCEIEEETCKQDNHPV